MTIEEKASLLDDFCDNQASCDDCPLKDVACDFHAEELDEAKEMILNLYNIVFGDAEALDAYAQSYNVQRHESICNELNALYVRKNADYGDSFHKTYVEEGIAMARIRLSDKLERFKRLTRSNEQDVQDESVRDTLIDLANYAIMTVMELDGEKE
jgi:hypothetical protein